MLAGPQSAKILTRLLTDPESFAGADGVLAKELEETGKTDIPFTAEQWAAVEQQQPVLRGRLLPKAQPGTAGQGGGIELRHIPRLALSLYAATS